jgi:hypothetical protein
MKDHLDSNGCSKFNKLGEMGLPEYLTKDQDDFILQDCLRVGTVLEKWTCLYMGLFPVSTAIPSPCKVDHFFQTW